MYYNTHLFHLGLYSMPNLTEVPQSTLSPEDASRLRILFAKGIRDTCVMDLADAARKLGIEIPGNASFNAWARITSLRAFKDDPKAFENTYNMRFKDALSMARMCYPDQDWNL